MTTNSSDYPKPIYAWYMVILLLVVYTFSFIDRQILGLLGPAIMRDFDITDTQFGLLTGYAFAVFYTVFGLVCARLADKGNRKLLIAAGLTLWSLMTAASGFAKTYAQLFLLRIGVGVGEATLAPAANSLIADSFPKEKLSTASSVYAMGIPVGSAIAFIIGGAVIQLAGALPDVTLFGDEPIRDWQKAFLIVGLPGLLLTFFVMALREPTRKGMIGSTNSLPISDVYQGFKKHYKAYTGICVGVSFTAALGFGGTIFLTLFFVRIHGLTPSDVGTTYGLIALFAGPLGLLAGGYIADKLLKKGRMDAHMIALMISPIGYFLPAVIFPLVEDLQTAWILVAIMTAFINLPTGIAFAGLQIISPNQMRGQMIALFVMTTNIIGYGTGPALVGVFNDFVFGDPMAIGKSLALLAATTTPLCLFFYVWGRRDFAAAMQKTVAEK